MSNSIIIAVTEIQTALNKDNSLEENLTIAMTKAKDHWLVTEEVDQFNSAITAVGAFYGKDSEEFRRIELDMDVLKAFNSGHFEAVIFSTVEKGDDKLNLVKLWKDA